MYAFKSGVYLGKVSALKNLLDRHVPYKRGAFSTQKCPLWKGRNLTQVQAYLSCIFLEAALADARESSLDLLPCHKKMCVSRRDTRTKLVRDRSE